MALQEDISLEIFCEEVISYSVNEFLKIRRGSDYSSAETLPYFEHVGKAVALFGMMHQRKVACTMRKVQCKVLSSKVHFDAFFLNFTDGFFQSLRTLPRQHFQTALLTFCGVIAAMTDFCFERGQFRIAEECVDCLEFQLESCSDEFHSLGGWKSLYKAATPFAKFYERGNWKIEMFF